MPGDNVTTVGVTRYYDTIELFLAKQAEVKEQFLNGEITVEEYENIMQKLTDPDSLADDVEKVKKEKYDELHEQYLAGDISDAQLEKEMDQLFETGDDFLDADTSEPAVDTEEVKFRIREILEIVAFFGSFIAILGLIIFTKGALLPAIIPLILLGFLIYQKI